MKHVRLVNGLSEAETTTFSAPCVIHYSDGKRCVIVGDDDMDEREVYVEGANQYNGFVLSVDGDEFTMSSIREILPRYEGNNSGIGTDINSGGSINPGNITLQNLN